ncbi:MAG: NAD(P)-dependent oxidoreductase [Nitrospira sp.]|nr:NAD(P)-dependent oxidoreductase [Nitrospira sp.]
MKKLLITGASGFLGWHTIRSAIDKWDVFGLAGSNDIDIPGAHISNINLCNYRELNSLFHTIRPDAVIHTAAATNPDYCQQYVHETAEINASVPVMLAKLCCEKDIPYIFTSTDLVFNGRSAPYSEDAPTDPLSVYGEQKVRAEQEVLRAYPKSVVCRMPLMFGPPSPHGSSALLSMVNAMRQGKVLKIFTDEFRTPLCVNRAADGLLLALEFNGGIFHLGGAERISRYDFGLLIKDIFHMPEVQIHKCLQRDINTPAPRAADVSLNSTKAITEGFLQGTLHQELQNCKKYFPNP